jgi:hypothetical protein
MEIYCDRLNWTKVEVLGAYCVLSDNINKEFKTTVDPTQKIVTFHQTPFQILVGMGSGICAGCANHALCFRTHVIQNSR